MFREPGVGSVEFAKEFVAGMTMEEARPVISKLVKGNLPEVAEKLVKRCNHCGYYFRDKRTNKARVCCKQCRANMDVVNRKKLRRAKVKPKKVKVPNKIDFRIAYAGHLKYPFYGGGDDFLRFKVWKHELPLSVSKLEYFGNKDRLNGRRKPKYSSNYNGDEIEQPHVKVRFSLAKVNRKPAEVMVSHKSREEIDEYLLEKYGAIKLEQERRRATTFRKWVY